MAKFPEKRDGKEKEKKVEYVSQVDEAGKKNKDEDERT